MCEGNNPCSYSEINRDKIDNNSIRIAELCTETKSGFKDMQITLQKLNDKLFVGVIAVIILAFFSGMNVMNNVVSLFGR